MSLFHLALVILSVLSVALHLSSTPSLAASTTIAWNAPVNADGTAVTGLSGYKVYMGTASGSYSQSSSVGNVTSYTVNNLTDGAIYYFAVTALNSSGQESPFSNEVSKTIATAPVPTTYTITATAGGGGTVQPTTAIAVSQATNGTSTISTMSVAKGSSLTLAITPASGYKVAGVAVDGAPVGAVTSYTFSNVTAAHSIAATFAATTGGTTSPGAVVTAINSGGTVFTDSYGIAYRADTYSNGGGVVTNSATIAGTADQSLYRTYRHGYVFSYAVPVANGSYTVKLRFAEPTATAAGKRVFDVSVQGATVLSNLDLYARAGRNTAYTVDIPVNVTNGSLKVGFNGKVDRAVINAIVVAKPETAPVPGPVVPVTYTIAATAGTGGAISPAGATSVTSGDSKTFTIAPASGYGIASVTVDGAPVGAVSSYTFTNVKANHTIAATFTAKAPAPTATTYTGVVVTAINCGGTAFTDTYGIPYKGDIYSNGGGIVTNGAAISGTPDQPLYRTYRHGYVFSYAIPIANGSYLLKLRFAEPTATAAGQRVFNVTAQGATVLSNFDLYAMAGKNMAYTVSIPVSVTNGTLTVGFTGKVDRAIIEGIVVTK